MFCLWIMIETSSCTFGFCAWSKIWKVKFSTWVLQDSRMSSPFLLLLSYLQFFIVLLNFKFRPLLILQRWKKKMFLKFQVYYDKVNHYVPFHGTCKHVGGWWYIIVCRRCFFHRYFHGVKKEHNLLIFNLVCPKLKKPRRWNGNWTMDFKMSKLQNCLELKQWWVGCSLHHKFNI